jgi:hypothetical protein
MIFQHFAKDESPQLRWRGWSPSKSRAGTANKPLARHFCGRDELTRYNADVMEIKGIVATKKNPKQSIRLGLS